LAVSKQNLRPAPFTPALGRDPAPVYDDPGALLPLLGVSVTLFAWPEAWQRFTAGGASSQALTPDSWQSLIAGDLWQARIRHVDRALKPGSPGTTTTTRS